MITISNGFSSRNFGKSIYIPKLIKPLFVITENFRVLEKKRAMKEFYSNFFATLSNIIDDSNKNTDKIDSNLS
jgi:uncharacterized protein (DUF608 family)